ncbi:MAG: glycosyltransferase [Bacteroidaceae bacterium]|nr:glycosyltransferase [Bacteroidaceae bacterium]
MHILELPSFFPPHGGLFCLEQAKALKAQGHEVRIVSIVELSLTKDRTQFLTLPWREERSEQEGVEVFCTYMRAVPKAVRCNVNRWTRLCEKAVDRYVRRYGKPDVLHAHCCKSAGLAAKRISQRLGIPYYISEHISSGLFERDFGKDWQRHRWLREEMRQAYEAANCVIPVSQELVDDLASFFGKAYRWQAVSNIIDTDFWSPRPSLSEEKAGFRFCCLAVANIYGKGYDVLAEALDLLPADIELHIAGRGTDSLPMQKLFGRRHGVHLHGELSKEEVRALLWQSDALVLPSRSEAQPLVLLEALATGIPVVGTECIPKSVRIPGGCLIAPVGDAKTLAEKMREVMKVQPSKDFFGAVERLASPSVVAKQLADIFKS